MARQTISLTFAKRGDRREPVKVELVVQDERTMDDIVHLDLTEHEFTLLMSGSVIAVEAPEPPSRGSFVFTDQAGRENVVSR